MEAPMDVAIVPSHTKCYAHTCTTSITLHTCKWKLIYTATVMYWCTKHVICSCYMYCICMPVFGSTLQMYMLYSRLFPGFRRRVYMYNS